MKKLLYVGHAYHKKTKSVGFLQELLESRYEVHYFADDPQSPARFEELAKLPVKEFDILVVFQIMPSIKEIKQHVSFKQGIFFPMYDYYHGCTPLSNPIWNEYKDFLIINFAQAAHKDLVKAGYMSRYIQYFPKPVEKYEEGQTDGLYFWQRLTRLNVYTVYALFKAFQLKNLHIHKVLDPSESFTPIPAEENNFCRWYFENMTVTESTWYDTREEMKQDIERYALYMAPRTHEGIGMSFLEAMAMGRCVIAPDFPTMNEYIRNGKTGLLYDWDKQKALELTPEKIREIQKNTYEYIKEGYARWEAHKSIIFKWMEEASQLKEERNAMKERFPRILKMICPDALYDRCQMLYDALSGNSFYWSTTSCRLFGIVPVIKIKRVDTRRMKLYIFGVPVWESIVADNRTPWEE